MSNIKKKDTWKQKQKKMAYIQKEKTLKKSQEDLIYLFSFFVVFLTYHVLSKIIPRYVLACTSRNDND